MHNRQNHVCSLQRIVWRNAPKEGGFTLLELLVVMTIIAVMTSMVMMVRSVPGADKKAEEEGKRLKVLISLAGEEAILTSREIGMQIYQEGYVFLVRADDGKWQNLSDKILKKRAFPAGFHVELALENRQVILPGEGDRDRKPQLVFGTTGESIPFKLVLHGLNGYHMTLSGNGRGGMQLQRSGKS
ncbi:MAG: type II secretion system minor pseudopilin GspH [Magnetococcales bacterium]|nr:type II secretion system minor pseudopilin GspH [Magnetococcales bacterium]